MRLSGGITAHPHYLRFFRPYAFYPAFFQKHYGLYFVRKNKGQRRVFRVRLPFVGRFAQRTQGSSFVTLNGFLIADRGCYLAALWPLLRNPSDSKDNAPSFCGKP